MRTKLARLAIVIATLTLFPHEACSAKPRDPRPNITFIFSDDHAPHAIGAYNGWLNSVNPTPKIDRLARQGMLFEKGFCTNSLCGPSRAVILTGKHSHINGFTNNSTRFDAAQPTFPKLLQKAGYQTAIFGKWHLQSEPQGFDVWKILPGQGLYYNPDFLTPEGKTRVEGYCTDIVTDMTLEWLTEQRDKEKPFMVMCQHKAPHRCWMPPPRYLNLYDEIEIPEPATLFDQWEENASPARNQEMEIDRHLDPHYDLFVDLTPEFRGQAIQQRQDKSALENLKRFSPEQLKVWRDAYGPKDEAFHAQDLKGKDLIRWKYQRYAKNYLRCIKGVDDCVGRVTDALAEAGLADNTIVIYSSDQGFFVGDHGWYDKRWMYEESLQMPLIVSWPGVTKPGSKCQAMVQNLDYAETFLELARATIPDDMQGASLVPLLKGETPEAWRDSVYYHYYEHPAFHMVARHYGIRTERYKLMHFYETREWELYDLIKDPDELTNQYSNASYASIIHQLKGQLTALRSRYKDHTGIPVASHSLTK